MSLESEALALCSHHLGEAQTHFVEAAREVAAEIVLPAHHYSSRQLNAIHDAQGCLRRAEDALGSVASLRADVRWIKIALLLNNVAKQLSHYRSLTPPVLLQGAEMVAALRERVGVLADKRGAILPHVPELH